MTDQEAQRNDSAATTLVGRVVIIDDEPDIRTALSGVLSDEGHTVCSADTAQAGVELVVEKLPDLCFLDVWLPDGDGLDVLVQIRKAVPNCQVIMISGHSTIETAVKATQQGAVDFLEKPLGLEKVLLSAQTALRLRRLTDENENLRGRIEEKYRLIGESASIERVRQQIQRMGRSQATVLITGENGTGKENVCRSIHAVSERAQGPFVAVNCAAIPEELIESELFGHEKGAFTGAVAMHRGKFELAHQGTLFLDEIGDMSLKTQSKLLRVLQDRQIERVGGTRQIDVDVRVIAATNKELREEIAKGSFREDLFYRLNVLPVSLPPLRDRGEDIILLARHFLADYCRENGEADKALSPVAQKMLRAHTWPGNVRELKNLMERMSILVAGNVVEAEDLQNCGMSIPSTEERVRPTEDILSSCDDFRLAKARFEREFILSKLKVCGFSVSKTAEKIGMERTHLYRKLKQLEIEVESEEAARE